MSYLARQNRTSLNKILKYTVFPLFVFVLFKEKISELSGFLIVKPFLSYVHQSKLVDVVTVSTSILVLLFFCKKVTKGAKMPFSWILLVIVWTVIYLTYRIQGKPFSFVSFSFSEPIKLLDLTVLVPTTIAIFSFLNNRSGRKKDETNKLAFAVDEPIVITRENDLLNRTKFINNLVQMISNTKSPNGSFPIGIVSPWGSGKTSFLISLRKEAERFGLTCIDLNLWKNRSPNQIIESFFRLLRENLEGYSFTINARLKEYANNLINDSKNELLKGLSHTFLKNASVEEQYEALNKEIEKINRKILVFIDDIDRLDTNEIYEVIRLIRNTANFANIFFIVAYDRNYILNAVEEINSYQSHIFLEKIFQVEFSLPPVEKIVVQKAIQEKLDLILTEESSASFRQFIRNDRNVYEGRKIDLAGNFIGNMRDVVRFVSAFHINYLYVEGEIYFPDFYNLQLIRFKHPEIFIEFFRNKEKFLFLGTRKNCHPQRPFTYALKKADDKDGPNKDKYEFTIYLESHRTIYKVDQIEIDLIESSFSGIFPQHNSANVSRWGPGAHLSVVNPSMLDRYFRLGIEGKLSEIDFSKARASDDEEFHKKIFEWCNDQGLEEQLQERFITIGDFDDIDDFKKIISGIFYLANLPTRGKARKHQTYVGYDGDSLASLLGRASVIKMFFENDLESYKSYVVSLLKIKQVEYSYTHDFTNYLLNQGRYAIGNLISDDEISELLFSYLEYAISHASRIGQVWEHFMRCQQRKEEKTGNQSLISHPINKKAFRILRKFIFEKDLDGFIRMCISRPDYNEPKYVLNDKAKFIFKSNEIFIRVLKGYKGHSVYKERFIEFYEAQKNKNWKEGLFFDFNN